jgi:hypothetical protein
MTTLDDFYTKDCGSVCPSYVRWYSIEGSLETARTSLIAEFERAGLRLKPNSLAPEIMT